MQVPVTSLAFHPTELLLASTSDDGTFKLWDCKMLSELEQFKNISRSMGELTSTVVRRLRNQDRPYSSNSVAESRAILNRIASMLRRNPNSDFFRYVNARLNAIESTYSQRQPSQVSPNAAVVHFIRRTPLYRSKQSKQSKQSKSKDKSERGSPKTDEDDSSASEGGGSKRLRHTRRRRVSRGISRRNKSANHKRIK